MDKEAIKWVIKDQGYTPYFKHRWCYSPHARQLNVCYVYVCRADTKRHLGNIEEVALLSEEQLRNLIAARFAQTARTRRARSGQSNH